VSLDALTPAPQASREHHGQFDAPSQQRRELMQGKIEVTGFSPSISRTVA
jgi:hypothetical protein